MIMPASVEVFSTSECPKCLELIRYLESRGITYTKRVIDQDPIAETDALMLNICSAPALRVNDDVYHQKALMTSGVLDPLKLDAIFPAPKPREQSKKIGSSSKSLVQSSLKFF